MEMSAKVCPGTLTGTEKLPMKGRPKLGSIVVYDYWGPCRASNMWVTGLLIGW